MVKVNCYSCGKEIQVHPYRVKHTKSFLCSVECRSIYQKDQRGSKANNYSHGLRYTKFYSTYRSMKWRCTLPSQKGYPYYGGRGIKFLWPTFELFRDDMYESYLAHVDSYGEKNTTLDRIDSDGNYSKENCRWATLKEQANNKRNNRIATYNGVTKTLVQWADEYGLNRHTIYRRIEFGWSIDKALTTPVRSNGKVG